jgi:hypothetical protein
MLSHAVLVVLLRIVRIGGLQTICLVVSFVLGS